jgi:hypothetical protein
MGYYLDQAPVLAKVGTHICRQPRALAHMAELVVKPVGEAGGYGLLVGPHAGAAGIGGDPIRSRRAGRLAARHRRLTRPPARGWRSA